MTEEQKMSPLFKSVNKALMNSKGKKAIAYVAKEMSTGSIELNFPRPSETRVARYGKENKQTIVEILNEKFEVAEQERTLPHLFIIIGEKKAASKETSSGNE